MNVLAIASLVVSFTAVDGKPVTCVVEDSPIEIRIAERTAQLRSSECVSCDTEDSFVYRPNSGRISIGVCDDTVFKDTFEG